MMLICVALPMPSHNTSSGVSASGGIMRSSASAMPAVQLIRNPTPMRASEAAACAASTPL